MTATTRRKADVERFRTEGFFVVDDLFSAAECDTMAAELEALSFELALGRPEDGQLSYRPMLHTASSALQRWCSDGRWADVVLPLLGGSARLFWEQGVAKPPQARTELPWHQDSGYTPTVPEEYVTCWVALDDADASNGCLWLQPRSHLQGRQPHRNDESFGPFRVGYDGNDDGVAVPVPKGSVLVFSSLLMHRSGPNTTDRPRRAWIIQFCPADAVSALSSKPLDDRLLVARDGEWLDEPVRERELDLLAILANYDRR
jgi:hypothetical protein